MDGIVVGMSKIHSVQNRFGWGRGGGGGLAESAPLSPKGLAPERKTLGLRGKALDN